MSSTNTFSGFTARLRALIDGKEQEFSDLALELFALQFEHNRLYQRFCGIRSVEPESALRWNEIPALPVSAFKEGDVSSLPAERRTGVFHSSGTTNQRPSRHFHSTESLQIYEASLWPWFAVNLVPDFGDQPANLRLIILTPPPSQAPHSSLVHMFDTVRRKLRSDESAFLGKVAAERSWNLDLPAVLDALHANERPALLLGTAFSFVHLLDHLADQDLRIELSQGSRALETGGYKGRSRSLPKSELHALITRRLGIPASRIVCEYGMSELSSQAYDHTIGPPRARHHAPRRFSFPPWARAQIISPETGQEAAEGETGLIRIFDLANVYSVMAIQTEDLGIRRGDTFELLGRAALAEPRGCSLTAA